MIRYFKNSSDKSAKIKRLGPLSSGFSLCLCLLLVLLIGRGAHVFASPEQGGSFSGQTASLTLQLHDHNQQILAKGGSTVELYQIASFQGLDAQGNPDYQRNEHFEGISLPAKVEGPEFAQQLVNYIYVSDLEADRLETFNAQGQAVFDNLPAGLYLLVHHQDDKDWKPFNSFLVSLPQKELSATGQISWNWLVTAQPKLDPQPGKSTETSSPDHPPIPTQPGKVEIPGEFTEGDQTSETEESKLPFTGMLRWPVPVMAILGALFFGVGIFLRKR